VVTVPAGATPAQVEQVANRTGFSRFPVQDSNGDLTGYLHLKDMLVTEAAEHHQPFRADLVRPLSIVGQHDRLRTVLTTMQATRSHLARVTDSTGSTVGIVALEDVLEELVGEVRDESRRSVELSGS
jgi:CBS domain containing-hemolysin-like protein